MVVLPHPGGPTIATPVLLFSWSCNWIHLFAISLLSSCSAQSSSKAFCRSCLSINVDDDGLTLGKTSSSKERNRGVSSSVNFGNIEALIAATNLSYRTRSFCICILTFLIIFSIDYIIHKITQTWREIAQLIENQIWIYRIQRSLCYEENFQLIWVESSLHTTNDYGLILTNWIDRFLKFSV